MKQKLGTVETRSREQGEYLEILKAVVMRGEAWCLVVSGKFGNGKTYLAEAAVNSFNDVFGGGAIYTTQPDIQAELRGGNNKDSYYRKLCSAPVLVIDEVSDRPTDWTEFIKTNIENVLIKRHADNLRTVLIGNVDMKRMKDMFDQRVLDRLREGLHKTMNGQSLRRNHA